MTADLGPSGQTGRMFHLLTVCTANQCRSPMTEVLAADQLARRRVPAEVTSRGLVSDGVPASPDAARAVSRFGLDLSEHRSRVVDPAVVEDADLILTMERRHIVAIAEMSVDAVDRTFTLPELADLAIVVGPRTSGRSVAQWIADAAGMRWPTSVLSANTDDDLRDPMGGPAKEFRRTAGQIERLLDVVLDALFPAALA